VILIKTAHSNNPYFNLAAEEFLIRNLDCSKGDYLFLYTNKPSVVVGKNQSIYKEVNFNTLRGNAVLPARRISGGGTVYHDEGNLNFAVFSAFDDSKINNYRYFNAPLVNALNKFGIPCDFNDRNDIICNSKKLSGNAQFTNRKNIISHGTLLVNSVLDNLRAALKQNDFKVESRSVASVSSSVMNISEIAPHISSVEVLRDMLVKELVTDTYELSAIELSEINALTESKFATDEWIYGRSPETTITKSDMQIEVERGIIKHIELYEFNLGFLSQLTGTPYTHEGIKKRLQQLDLSGYSLSALLQAIF
jgi:lipoate-protein ligase A